MSMLIQPGSAAVARRQIQRWQQHFDSHSAVFAACSQQLLERLELLAIEPDRVLDLGSRSCYQLNELGQRYEKAEIFGCDLATSQAPPLPSNWPAWLRRAPKAAPVVDCDPHCLPFASESFDLIISNLLLPWCHSPHQVFEEVARLLRPGGAFMFTTAGPDTLLEYRALWAAIDGYSHQFGLIDMHDIGDSLMASGFAAPVLDRDTLSVDYPGIEALQQELRYLGAGNIAVGRRPGLMSPKVLEMLNNATKGMDRFPVSLELVHGHAWKGELRPSGQNSGSEYKIPVDSLRGSRGGKIGK